MRITDFPLLLDVKEEYLELRKSGMCRSNATNEMLERYSSEICCGVDDDGPLFWIGLADGQYTNRELTSEIAKQAENALDLVERAGWGVTPGDLSRRKIWYRQAPMPEKKLGAKRAKYRCEWNVGDTFAYQLSGAAAEENGVSGQYVLLRKVSDVEFGDGRLLPVVTLSLWEKPHFPVDEKEFMTAQILRVNCGRFALPNNLYEYRVEIIVKNKKQLNAIPLIYVGQFTDVQAPDDEVVVEGAGYMTMMHPESFDSDLNLRIKVSRLYESRLANTNSL